MKKLLKAIQHLSTSSLWAIGLASLMLMATLFTPQHVYAASQPDRATKEVIQPFELTNPAATREEAYDDIANLNKNPKELIAAENKEEQAEEKAYQAAQKAARSVRDK